MASIKVVSGNIIEILSFIMKINKSDIFNIYLSIFFFMSTTTQLKNILANLKEIFVNCQMLRIE